MSIAAIVLAAGASRRLGQPKQTICLGPETLLERAVRLAHLAGLIPVYAVVARDGELPLPLPLHATMVINPNAAEGIASSIRTGILAADCAGTEGAVILACDQPAVTSRHLRELIRNNCGGEKIVASSYAERKGIPAFFPASSFDRLLTLRGDTGARELIADATAVPLLHGEIDIDTVEDLVRAQALYPDGLPE